MDRDGNTLLLAGDYILLAAAATFALFVIAYSALAPKWWKKTSGWNVMGVAFCMVMLLLLNLSAVYFGPWYLSIRPYARIVVYSLTAVVGGQRLWWFWRAHVKKGLDDEELAAKLRGTP